MEEIVNKLMQDERVQKALQFLQDDQENMLAELLELVQIPAFSNHEQQKAAAMRDKFAALGLKDVHIDKEDNAMGTLPGTGNGPTVMIAAHTDTVFPLDTPLTPKEKNGVWYAPGINDDTHGLADLLTIIRAIKVSGLEFDGDIIFCANSGEEGLGDLRGVKHIFGQPNHIAAFISLDTPTLGGIVHRATGSTRYKVTFHGPGGHSFADFDRPSAIHAMGRAIAKISDFKVPDNPKTTFNVGVISGGTSINTIAAEASFLLDIRSDSPIELARIENEAKAAIHEAVEAENHRSTTISAEQATHTKARQAIHTKTEQAIHTNEQSAHDHTKLAVYADIQQVGSRPAGAQTDDCLIVQLAKSACHALSIEPELRDETSTDANIPISLGIPALSLGRGGKEGGVHTTSEWFDSTEAWLGPQRDLILLLLMAGLSGVTEAQIPKR